MLDILKTKKLIKYLNQFDGTGTSMVTFFIPYNEQISEAIKIIDNNIKSAKNVKSSKNSKNVIMAYESINERLKIYNKLPNNGLIIFSGIDDNEKKILIDFEPPKILTFSLFHCDNIFITK